MDPKDFKKWRRYWISQQMAYRNALAEWQEAVETKRDYRHKAVGCPPADFLRNVAQDLDTLEKECKRTADDLWRCHAHLYDMFNEEADPGPNKNERLAALNNFKQSLKLEEEPDLWYGQIPE